MEPEIDSLRGSDVDIRADEENAVRRESDDVVELPLLHIDHLKNVSGARPKQPRLLYDEQLFLLRRPHESPSAGERLACRDGATRHGLDGVHDCVSLRGVFLGPETSILVGDELQQVPFGPLCRVREDRTDCTTTAERRRCCWDWEEERERHVCCELSFDLPFPSMAECF